MILNETVNNSWTSSLICKSGADILDQVYTFKTEIDRDNNTATLVTGYHGTEDFDSYFILSKNDLLAFKNMIDTALSNFNAYDEVLKTNESIKLEILKDIKNYTFKEIKIEYKELLDCNPYESLYGSIWIDVTLIADDNIKKCKLLLSPTEFLSIDNIKELPVFEESTAEKYTVVNPAYRDETRNLLYSVNPELKSSIFAMPKAIEKEDMEALKNKILADIDKKYNK